MIRSGERTPTAKYERFRTIEYCDAHGTVTIIQDTQNDRAWLQSTVTLEVRR